MRHFVPKRVSRPLRTERAHEDVFQTKKGLLPNVWDSAPSFIARKESYMHFSKKISMVMESSFQSIQCGCASKCRGTECFARSGAASCKRRLLLLNIEEMQTDLFQLPKQGGTIDKLPSPGRFLRRNVFNSGSCRRCSPSSNRAGKFRPIDSASGSHKQNVIL